MNCAICSNNNVSDSYPYLVCLECDSKALNSKGEKAKHAISDPEFIKDSKKMAAKSILLSPPDGGDNPIFIDRKKCWRRYRFGGWVTMFDPFNCESINEFYKKTNLFK